MIDIYIVRDNGIYPITHVIINKFGYLKENLK